MPALTSRVTGADGLLLLEREMEMKRQVVLIIVTILTLLFGILKPTKAYVIKGFLLIPSDNVDGSTYELVDLGMAKEGDTINFPAAINNKGQVTGYSMPRLGIAYTNNEDVHSYLHENGRTAYIGNGRARGINDMGQIVGNEWPKNFSYVNGRRTHLDLGYEKLFVTGINNIGQIIGYSDGQSGLERGCFLFENGALNSFGGDFPKSINDQGAIVGANGTFVFLYEDRQMRNLAEGFIYTMDINNHRQVAGSSEGTAFLWEDDVLQSIGSLGGESFAYAINDNQQIVGFSHLIPRIFERTNERAFIYENGIMKDLNTLISSDSDWVMSRAVDINNSGWIIAYGVPEPVTILLLGLGTVVLRRKRRTLPSSGGLRVGKWSQTVDPQSNCWLNSEH